MTGGKILQIIDQNEDRPRGTYEFPFEFHHIDENHPRYIMSYHWHVEYEIIRILSGEFTVTLDEKSFKATQGDVIFVVEYQDTTIDISQGNIDLKSTHKQIVDIMEGGEEAFDKRQLIYTSWK